MEQQAVLTESMEDYLISIYRISRSGRRPRVIDIARDRSVSPASVCQALRKLDRDGLVRYSSGRAIALTEEGARAAQRLASRHDFLLFFLRDILGVEPSAAESDACALEHHVSSDTLSHLVAFAQFTELRMLGGAKIGAAFRGAEPTGCLAAAPPGRCRRRRGGMGRTLSDLPPGGRARILHLHSDCAARQRLAEMGLLPGVEIEMVRRAPLGGPVEIRLENRSLTLRRREAASVEVEEAPPE